MTIKVSDHVRSAFPELRYEPTEKRVRAWLGDTLVADSRRAVLVWEPLRILPLYAVPRDDIRCETAPSVASPVPPELSDAAFVHPGIPFAVHTAEGSALELADAAGTRTAEAFQLTDPVLDGYVVLDYVTIDRWMEEDEVVEGHPRDPFHRVDVRASRGIVQVESHGELLASSNRPLLVFETNLPARFYLPREDVTVPLRATARRTICPYKGEATYFDAEIGGQWRSDVFWSYPRPLPDAVQLAGHLGFFDDLVDVSVESHLRERPDSPFVKKMLEEFDA